MKPLLYRVTDLRVFKSDTGVRWDAYLVIRGVGKTIRGELASVNDLQAALARAVTAQYLAVTGEKLVVS